MNLTNYYWYFQSVVPSRLCDDIIKYAKSIKDQMALTGGFSDPKKLNQKQVSSSNDMLMMLDETYNDQDIQEQQIAIDHLEKILEKLTEEQLQGKINLNSKQKKKVIPFVQTNNWSFDCYLDPSAKSMIAIEGKEVPLTLILDDKGAIVWRLEGFDSNTIKKIQEQLSNMTEK